MNKNIFIGILVVIILILGGYLIWHTASPQVAMAPSDQTDIVVETSPNPPVPTEQSDTMEITIMVPNDMTAYMKIITDAMNEGNPSSKTHAFPFVKKTIAVQKTDDVILSSAEAAALEIPSQADSQPPLVRYLKIVNDTAYVVLNMDIDGWAGVSNSIYAIHPLVEKTLLQFPQIHDVKFGVAPGDNINNVH